MSWVYEEEEEGRSKCRGFLKSLKKTEKLDEEIEDKKQEAEARKSRKHEE